MTSDNVVTGTFAGSEGTFNNPTPRAAMTRPEDFVCNVFVDGLGILVVFGGMSTLRDLFNNNPALIQLDRVDTMSATSPVCFRGDKVLGITYTSTHQDYWSARNIAEAEEAARERMDRNGRGPRRPQ